VEPPRGEAGGSSAGEKGRKKKGGAHGGGDGRHRNRHRFLPRICEQAASLLALCHAEPSRSTAFPYGSPHHRKADMLWGGVRLVALMGEDRRRKKHSPAVWFCRQRVLNAARLARDLITPRFGSPDYLRLGAFGSASDP